MGSTRSSEQITLDWLDGKRRSVRHANIHVFDDMICSYGTHFPMVIRTDDPNVMLVNESKYSVSTSIHQSGVRGALYYRGFVKTDEVPESSRAHDYSDYRIYRREA